MKQVYLKNNLRKLRNVASSFIVMTFFITVSQWNFAQVSTYAFSTTTSTFTPITGGILLGSTTTDDQYFVDPAVPLGGFTTTGVGLPIGFTFTYNAQNYDVVAINNNGWMSFGNSALSPAVNCISSSGYDGLSSVATTTPTHLRNRIAMLSRDIQAQAGSSLRIETIGVAPNRVCVIQFLDYKKYGTNGTGDLYDFQLRLYETSNVVEIVYGDFVNNATAIAAQVGLGGSVPTDFNNRTTTTNWAATTAGAANTATCTATATVVPLSGTTFRWAGPPPTPPVPFQAAGIPSCATGTNLDVTGTPDVDVSWYWQATATGTSMANLYAGPYAVFANGNYYLRAYNSVTMAWSTNSSMISITNFPLAPMPPVPTADQNPACVTSGSVLTAAVAPAGTEYYWQGTDPLGTSSALPATSTYMVSTSGTYYLAAYETASQCWSDASNLAVSIETAIPNPPIVDPSVYFYCTSAATMMVSAELPADGSCSTTATASGTDASGVAPMITDFSCATGTIMGATLNATIGGVCPGWYDYDIIVNGVTVATGQCNQTGFDLTPYLPLTSVSLLSYDNDNFSDFINMSMTINLNYQAGTSLSWYDDAVGGTPFATALSAETIGSTAMPVAAPGSYDYFVRTDLGTCSSTSSMVTVNVSDVVVDLLPLDVSCNNGTDGSFVVSNIECGTPPFAFAVDGGAFGAPGMIPTDLTVGTHTVTVMDAGSSTSDEYTITINDALAPSGLIVNTFSSSLVDLSWIANASETSWNVEWGAPGFLPGTGDEIGMATATDTNYVVTGLDGNTIYDFYVSADCGIGSTTGSWISVTQLTLCNPIAAQGYCETFDSNSPTEACWSVLNANADLDSWDMNYTFNTFSGDQVAAMYTDFNNGNNNDWLISPGMILTANEIMTFQYRVQSTFEPNDFEVLLSTTGTNPADFTDTLMALNSYSNITYADTSINLSAFAGTCYIAFHVPNGGLDGWRLYIDQVCIDICTPAPGVDGSTDVCRLDGTLDLNSVITQGETNGVWNFAPNPAAVNGSDLTVSAIPNGVFTAQYVVTTACVVDTTVATFTIFPPSSAGTDGVLTVCKNQPINLLSGLSGLIDLGGTWYNPTGGALSSGEIITGNLPGQFNYNYIVNNGVCPNDTANIVMNVLSTCDYAGLDDFVFEALAVYPNPSTGIFNISNVASGLNFSYEVSDLNGRIITGKENLNGKQIQEVDLTKVENGIYMVRIFNESGEFMTRIVKQ